MKSATFACLLGLGLTGCAAEVSCPRDLVRNEDRCVCPEHTILEGGKCVPGPTDGTGRTGGGRGPSDGAADAGSVGRDGAVVGNGGGAPDPRPSNDPDASSGGGGPASDGGTPAPPPPAPCPASCATKRCDNQGTCLAALPVCGDGHIDRELGEVCDDGNRNNDDDCVSCQSPTCGDGFINRAREDCDPRAPNPDNAGLSELFGAWTPQTCGEATHCLRTIYQICKTDDDCMNAFCAGGFCAPITCDPETNPDPRCRYPECPRAPGFVPRIQAGLLAICLLECGREGTCPRDMRCADGQTCVGKDWTPENDMGSFKIPLSN